MHFKFLAVLFLALFLFSSSAYAQPKKMALGFRFGEPTAFNFRLYLKGGKNCLDLSLGGNGYGYYRGRKYWDGEYRGGLVLVAHYVWNWEIHEVPGLYWYAGLGVQLGTRRYKRYQDQKEYNNFNLGLSGAVGVEYYIPKTPLSVFLEVGPYLELAPYPGWINADSGIGLRFNF